MVLRIAFKNRVVRLKISCLFPIAGNTLILSLNILGKVYQLIFITLIILADLYQLIFQLFRMMGICFALIKQC